MIKLGHIALFALGLGCAPFATAHADCKDVLRERELVQLPGTTPGTCFFGLTALPCTLVVKEGTVAPVYLAIWLGEVGGHLALIKTFEGPDICISIPGQQELGA